MCAIAFDDVICDATLEILESRLCVTCVATLASEVRHLITLGRDLLGEDGDGAIDVAERG